MKIRMRIKEEVTYLMDIEVPDEEANNDLKKWVRENGEEIWCDVGEPQKHFECVESRYVEFVRVLP
jgi:hypothetical protein